MIKLNLKSNPIVGKNIKLRLVEPHDAEFILSLRLDANKSLHISKTSPDIQKQIDFINFSSASPDEYYFTILSHADEKLGVVRVYDLQPESFCWGSWLIKDGAPISTAIESALLIYDFGFYTLNFKKAHFDVRKANASVVSFHKRMGAKIVSEDELNYYFKYDLVAYENIKSKYAKFCLSY